MQDHPVMYHQEQEPSGFWFLLDDDDDDDDHDDSNDDQDMNKDDPVLPPVTQEPYDASHHGGGYFKQQRKKARTVSIGHDCIVGTTALLVSSCSYFNNNNNNNAHNTSSIMDDEAMLHEHEHDRHAGMYQYMISSPPRRKISYAKSAKVFGSKTILEPMPIRMEGYNHAQYHNMMNKDHHHTNKRTSSATAVNGQQGQQVNHDGCNQPFLPRTPTPLHYDCDHRKFGFSEYHRMVHSIHCESPFYKDY